MKYLDLLDEEDIKLYVTLAVYSRLKPNIKVKHLGCIVACIVESRFYYNPCLLFDRLRQCCDLVLRDLLRLVDTINILISQSFNSLIQFYSISSDFERVLSSNVLSHEDKIV